MDPITFTTDTVDTVLMYTCLAAIISTMVALVRSLGSVNWARGQLVPSVIVMLAALVGGVILSDYEDGKARQATIEAFSPEWRDFYDMYETLENPESRHTLVSRFMVERVLCTDKTCSKYTHPNCETDCKSKPRAGEEKYAAHMKKYHANDMPIPNHSHNRSITRHPITPAQLDLMVSMVDAKWTVLKDRGRTYDNERKWLLKNASTYLELPETGIHGIVASLDHSSTKQVVVEKFCSNKNFTLTVAEYDGILTSLDDEKRLEMINLLTPHVVLSPVERVALAGGKE